MGFFDRFKNNKVQHEIPEASTIMGHDGNYDPRVLVRNLAYDALLGEAADEVLHKVFDLPPVSQEGQEALQRDSEERLSKVIMALSVVNAAVDTVLRIVAEFGPDDLDPEIKERGIAYESDVATRCVLATLSCLVDIGMVETNLPKAKVMLIKTGDSDE